MRFAFGNDQRRRFLHGCKGSCGSSQAVLKVLMLVRHMQEAWDLVGKFALFWHIPLPSFPFPSAAGLSVQTGALESFPAATE